MGGMRVHYLAYNEPIQHRTGDLPLAFYHVDPQHPRYHMRMHWHRETELLWMLRGEMRLYVEDVPLDLRTGDFAVIGEGALHGAEEVRDAAYECVVLDPYALLMHVESCKSALKEVVGRTIFLENRALRAAPDLSAALARLYDSVRSGVSCGGLRAVGALYEVFGLLTGQLDAAVRTDTNRAGVKAEQLKPALEYIEQNYGSKISLETLARSTGLSPKYFCRCVRAIIHRSPIDYLNHYRIECASFLLATSDMTVAEVAQRCGYNDSSFFIKQFRRYKHTTPRQYKASLRPEQA